MYVNAILLKKGKSIKFIKPIAMDQRIKIIKNVLTHVTQNIMSIKIPMKISSKITYFN